MQDLKFRKNRKRRHRPGKLEKKGLHFEKKAGCLLYTSKELGILSPLAECGMTKKEIRELAQTYQISVAKRPSGPCLATRFPYGTKLSYERMEQAEQGERFLRSLGFSTVRLRVHGKLARIEVKEAELGEVLKRKKEIIQYLKGLGYVYISIDLEGFRSGSMDADIEDGEKDET